MAKHTVVVGNIGNVVIDGRWKDADEAYREYRRQSKEGYGRAAGEDVVWFKDGEIYMEFVGDNTRSDADEAADEDAYE